MIDLLKEKWKLIEGSTEYHEMSRVVREDDPEYLICYVLTEWRNPHQRADDLAGAQLLTAAPDLLRELLGTASWLEERATVVERLGAKAKAEAARLRGRAVLIRQVVAEKVKTIGVSN